MERKKPSFEHYLVIFVLIGLVGSFVFVLYIFQQPPTGKAVLGISTSYLENETLQGQLSLALKSGELIPKDSIINVKTSENTYQYNLSDFVDLETIEGDFYAEDVVLVGSGEGYGIVGSKEIIEDVEFTLKIIDGKEKKEKKDKTEKEEERVEEEPEEIVEEEIIEEVIVEEEEPADELIEPEEETHSVITGEVVAELSEEIIGTTNINEPFTYELQEGQTVEITDSDQDVELTIDGNIVTVTTTYTGEGENGFGEQYLGDDVSYELEIDVSDFGIIAEEGDLEISLQYKDVEIVSVSTTLSVESSEQSNQSSISKSNATIILEDVEDYVLSDGELFILQSKTGDRTVQISKAEVVNNRLVVRFEIGEFWLENSYSYQEGDDLSEQIALDQAKWLKRLSNSIDDSSFSSESVGELLGESEIFVDSVVDEEV